MNAPKCFAAGDRRRRGREMRISAVIFLASACAVGCAPTPPSTGPHAHPGPFVPLDSRIDVFPRHPALIGVQSGPTTHADTVPLGLSDGPALDARLVCVRVEVADTGVSWLPSSGAWSVGEPKMDAPRAGADPAPPSGRAVASWMVLAEPGSKSLQPAVRLGETVVPVRALDVPPPGSKLPGPIVEDTRTAAVPPASMLDPDLRSPVRRWRYRLAAHKPWPGTSNADGVPAFDDPVLEELAQQTELKWWNSLNRLERENRGLYDRLIARLAGSADFGEGAIAPTWTVSLSQTDALLADLLDPALNADERRERVESWIAEQPGAVAWVVDDAARTDAETGQAMFTVALLNLGDRAELARVAVEGKPAVGDEPIMLGPGAVRYLTLASPAANPSAARAPVEFTARIGAANIALPVHSRATPAEPPGLPLGPFRPDFTLDSWRGVGTERADRTDPGVVAMLFRGDRDSWRVYVETAGGPGSVRLRFGPALRTWIVDVHPDALVSATGPDARSFRADVIVRSAEGRTAYQIAVPDEAIEAGGVLRLSIERRDAGGRRSSFPRPMLPWQDRSGKALVDLRAWDR